MGVFITSFSQRGYQLYGRRFLETRQQCCSTVPVIVYSEDSPHGDRALGELPAFTRFLQRHANSENVSGRLPHPSWREKDKVKRYSFRTDALKFCRKVFAVADAARRLERGTMFWIDADTVFFARPPHNFFDLLLGDDDVAYLGRPRGHSECGFIGFRLPEAMPLIGAWESYYANDRFFDEAEWHDSWLFDRAREQVPSVKCRSLSKPGDSGHVWVRSPLGQYIDHLKGQRKHIGFSPERRGNETSRKLLGS